MKKVFKMGPMIFTAILLLIACKKENTSSYREYPHWPLVQTLVATNVDSTAATLNGAVNAFGVSTTVIFEYGTTTSYGDSITVFQSPVTGDSLTHVNAVISGLTPCTIYYFRVKAENSKWINFYGPDSTFITLPRVKTLAETDVYISGATLNGAINANFLSTTVTFEYGTTTSYGQEITAEQSPITGNTITYVSATLTGLTHCIEYHFRVKAENSFEVVYGNDLTFTTGGIPTLTTTSISGITSTTAVTGGEITDDSCVDITDRGVICSLRIPPGPGSRRTHDGTGTGSFISNLTGLKSNTTYYVFAYTTNSAGIAFGDVLSFTTLP
jgi:hypothetical protein